MSETRIIREWVRENKVTNNGLQVSFKLPNYEYNQKREIIDRAVMYTSNPAINVIHDIIFQVNVENDTIEISSSMCFAAWKKLKSQIQHFNCFTCQMNFSDRDSQVRYVVKSTLYVDRKRLNSFLKILCDLSDDMSKEIKQEIINFPNERDWRREDKFVTANQLEVRFSPTFEEENLDIDILNRHTLFSPQHLINIIHQINITVFELHDKHNLFTLTASMCKAAKLKFIELFAQTSYAYKTLFAEGRAFYLELKPTSDKALLTTVLTLLCDVANDMSVAMRKEIIGLPQRVDVKALLEQHPKSTASLKHSI